MENKKLVKYAKSGFGLATLVAMQVLCDRYMPCGSDGVQMAIAPAIVVGILGLAGTLVGAASGQTTECGKECRSKCRGECGTFQFKCKNECKKKCKEKCYDSNDQPPAPKSKIGVGTVVVLVVVGLSIIGVLIWLALRKK